MSIRESDQLLAQVRVAAVMIVELMVRYCSVVIVLLKYWTRRERRVESLNIISPPR